MQKPILLQGHERSITQIKYNREGDLLFSVAKDQVRLDLTWSWTLFEFDLAIDTAETWNTVLFFHVFSMYILMVWRIPKKKKNIYINALPSGKKKNIQDARIHKRCTKIWCFIFTKEVLSIKHTKRIQIGQIIQGRGNTVVSSVSYLFCILCDILFTCVFSPCPSLSMCGTRSTGRGLALTTATPELCGVWMSTVSFTDACYLLIA